MLGGSPSKARHDKAIVSDGGQQVRAEKGGAAMSSSSKTLDSRPTLTHGKDAKLVHRVSEASDRQRDPSKVLEPKSIGRKAVFRPILASPFVVDWPNVNPADAAAVFHTLLSFLQLAPLQDKLVRRNEHLPRSSSAKTKEKNQRRRARLLLAALHRQGITPALARPTSDTVSRDVASTSAKHDEEPHRTSPAILCGLNSVTRLLEERISAHAHFHDTNDDRASQGRPLHNPSIIVVCQVDVSPPALVSHMPLLVSTYNAMCKQTTALIRLPSGSESLLSDAVQLRRCSVLSLDFAGLQAYNDTLVSDGLKELQQKLKDAHIRPMHMPWLEQAVRLSSTPNANSSTPPAASSMELLPLRIKHLRSSAPVDINALKASKRAKRLQSRQKHKDRVARTRQLAIKKKKKRKI